MWHAPRADPLAVRFKLNREASVVVSRGIAESYFVGQSFASFYHLSRGIQAWDAAGGAVVTC